MTAPATHRSTAATGRLRTPAERLLADLLGRAVASGMEVAVIRPPGRDGSGRLEADVLVAPIDRERFERLLVSLGLRRRPGWGRRPHRFFITPVIDPVSGPPIDWLKVDTVTDLAFGPRHEIRTGTGARCLRERGRQDREAARLDPSDELIALLLHALLDRGELRDRDLRQLATLAPRAAGPGAAARPALTARLGEQWWVEVIDAAQRGDRARLLAQALPVRRALIDRRRAAVAWRRGTASILRHSTKVLTAVDGRGPLVAFVGPDGTGKTTLTTALADHAGMPARCLYGGTYPTSMSASTLPGMTTARVVGRLLGTRCLVLWHRSRGRLVILDRHPLQARPVAGDERLSTRARLRRRLIAVTLPTPDLLVVLDAPTTVLHDRRPEHSVEHLDRDRNRHRALVGRTVGSPSLQADRPADVLLDDAIALIWSQAMADRRSRTLVGP